MNSFQVSLFLSCCVYLIYRYTKRITGGNTTYRIFVLLLFLMVTAGFFFDVESYYWGAPKLENLILFITLLFFTSSPWILFDRNFQSRGITLNVSIKGVEILKTTFIIVIISSLISMVYIAPYAIASFTVGALEIRNNLSGISVLPANVLSTFSVAVGMLSPLYLLFFFISFLDEQLKRYSLLLFVSSFTYIVASMPFMARDGFVVLPIFFAIYYLLFRNNYDDSSQKSIKKYLVTLSLVAGVLLMIFSVSRFFEETSSGFDQDKFLAGTWGYLFQQPFVFDRTINVQSSWHGVSLRFPILSFLTDEKPIKVERYQDFETMFGTMLSEFYSVGGYWSLFIFTLVFTAIYYFGIRKLLRCGDVFSILWFFSVYLMLEVTGLFYMRYGGISNNWLFLVLTTLSFVLPKNIIETKYE